MIELTCPNAIQATPGHAWTTAPKVQGFVQRWLQSLKESCGLVLGTITLAGLLACSSSGDKETLTVFAAASLTQAFTEIARAFEQGHSEVSVILTFDGSQRLRLQLEHGAKADVFASADERQMDLAQESGLLGGEAVPFAANTLVVAVSAQAGAEDGSAHTGATIHSLKDLAGEDVKLVLAHSEVPAGRYALTVINSLADDPEFGPQYSALLLANIVSQEPNVRGVLQKVTMGEADAGFVYTSDLRSNDNILALTVPSEANVAAVYPIAVLRDSAELESAELFISFLTSPRGQKILQEHGFNGLDSHNQPTSSRGGNNLRMSYRFAGPKMAHGLAHGLKEG